jgi:hypothetical protein
MIECPEGGPDTGRDRVTGPSRNQTLGREVAYGPPSAVRKSLSEVSEVSRRLMCRVRGSASARLSRPGAEDLLCGRGGLYVRASRPTAGWVKARHGERSESRPEHSERSERPRSGEGGRIARFAVDAHCCGALGCHHRGLLLEVVDGGETRVLCPEHARKWLSL